MTTDDSRDTRGPVTDLLTSLTGGRTVVRDELWGLVYDELHRMARRQLAQEYPGHLLQPTALVHEAFIRLVDQTRVKWRDRHHFFAIAAQAMRRVLVDYARSRAAVKRRAPDGPSLDLEPGTPLSPEDLLAIGEALSQLAALDAQQATIVELRFFGGLTIEETAEALVLSPATIKRDWSMARAWLFRQLGGLDGDTTVGPG